MSDVFISVMPSFRSSNPSDTNSSPSPARENIHNDVNKTDLSPAMRAEMLLRVKAVIMEILPLKMNWPGQLSILQKRSAGKWRRRQWRLVGKLVCKPHPVVFRVNATLTHFA